MKTWMSVGLLFVATSPWATAAPALKDRSSSPPIVGEWKIEEGQVTRLADLPIDEFVDNAFYFKFTTEGQWYGRGSEPGRYTIDPKAARGTIRLTHPTEERGDEATVTYSGTFKVVGDYLILRLSATGVDSLDLTLRRVSSD